MPGRVLILGANGRFGRNACEAFWNAGWRLHLFDRATDDLLQAARDVDVIVHGWNPAYSDWQAQVPRQTAQVIEAARQNDATVILPGNLYVYGKSAGPILGPDTPHLAQTPLGRVRIAMEDAFRQSGVQTVILRAGDFIDTEASGNWFDRVITAPLAKGRIVLPGRPDALHSWAFLPDMARAAEGLARKRHDLPRFSDVPFTGYSLTYAQLADALEQVVGRPLRRTSFPWWQIHLARPVWPLARHLLEMRYLWDMPHQLDDGPLRTLLPDFQSTDLHDALRQAIPASSQNQALYITAGQDRPTQGHAQPHRIARAT